MMFMGSEISSSSIEVMPNDIGSELEGRPEILRMDQNPQQPALPLNPHALPAIPHAEQAEISHPAPAAGQLPIEGLLESQWVSDREKQSRRSHLRIAERRWIATSCCTPLAGNLRALGAQI
jgi:hypothetical protein